MRGAGAEPRLAGRRWGPGWARRGRGAGRGAGPYKAEECAAVAGWGRGRGSPALFGLDPRPREAGCSRVNPQAARAFPIVDRGGDGGE